MTKRGKSPNRQRSLLNALIAKTFWFIYVVFDVMFRATRSFIAARAPEAAASIAYYALFSIFPLILLTITIGTNFLDDQAVTQQILDYTAEVLNGPNPGGE